MKTRMLLLVCLLPAWLTAQEGNSPERDQVTISFQNIAPSEALEKLEAVSDLHFSYNSNMLDDRVSLSARFTDQPLEDILRMIFGTAELEILHLGQVVIVKKSKPSPIKRSCPPDNQPEIREIKRVDDRTPNECLKKAVPNYITVLPEIEPLILDSLYFSEEAAKTFLPDNTFRIKLKERPIFAGRSFPVADKRLMTSESGCVDQSHETTPCRFKPRPISFTASFNLSPHLSYSGTLDKYAFGSSGGIILGAWLYDRIGLTSGLHLSKQTIRYSAPEENAEQLPTVTSLWVFGFPAELSCKAIQGSHSAWYISSGLYNYFFSNKEIEFTDKTSDKLEWACYVDVGTIVTWNIGEQTKFFIGPFYRYPVSGPDYLFFRQKLGLNLGIQVHFGEYLKYKEILK